MAGLGSAVQFTGIALLILILALLLLRRREAWHAYRVFVIYIGFDLTRTVACAATLSHPDVYSHVFWTTAPLEVLLAVLAVHESFRNVFRVFYLLPWFRICFPTGIVIALSYSALRSYFHPPVHASGVHAAIISGMLAAQYVVLTIALIFFALVKLLQVPWRIHEFRIVLGFGLSAGITALAASLRSDFGTRFAFLIYMVPALTYIVSLAIWLSAVVHPLPARTRPASESSPELSPEEVVSKLTRELTAIRSLLKRG
jgi:hypothetical protein